MGGDGREVDGEGRQTLVVGDRKVTCIFLQF